MNSFWHDPSVATSYTEASHDLAEDIGYPAVFASLGLGAADGPKNLLDYGCGAGHTAHAATRLFGVHVCAVDMSLAMLSLARREAHHLIDFRHTEDGGLGFLPDGSMDAAMCGFVFVCVPERERLGDICRDILRVLRPGGKVAVWGADPATIGTGTYDGWQTEPGPYSDGAAVHSRLRQGDGSWVDVTDTFWTAETYRGVLTEAGFAPVTTSTLSSNSPSDNSGLILVTGEKP
ncbi:class I SAM-dependent methyltransferase [Actinokineospora sp. G85]|uniref:class I SAM-dependent methyltransferase n=1 Tax=Actinokineospora sp. G85 TaxID=3406626 RepID=UPI003C78EB6D